MATAFKSNRLLAAAILAGAALTGAACQPQTSRDSIFSDAERVPDPASYWPYLGRHTPASEEAASLRESAARPEPAPAPPAPAAIQSVDVPTQPPDIRVRVAHLPPARWLGAKTVALAGDIPRAPVVEFDIDPRMGEFRSAAIQVFRVVSGRVDLASGVRISEDPPAGAGELGNLLIAPGKEIRLPQPGPRARVVHIATGQPRPDFALSAGQDYEIQFLVSASRQADALAVRVHVAPPASQPDGP